MRFTTVFVTTLATMALASPVAEDSATLDSRQSELGALCNCHPNCGCDGGTYCFCEESQAALAPCFPDCGCNEGDGLYANCLDVSILLLKDKLELTDGVLAYCHLTSSS